MNDMDTKDQAAHGCEWDVIGDELKLSGALILPNVEKLPEKILKALSGYRKKELRISLKEVTRLDSAGVAFLDVLAGRLKKSGKNVRIVDVPEPIEQTLSVFRLNRSRIPAAPPKASWIERLGEAVYDFWMVDFVHFLHLMADIFYWTFTDIVNHRQRRKGEFVNQTILMGANAVPIIGIISLLIGLVLALQSAAQLRQFGANIYVADLIVISMTQEMGPLLTAIMVAGRSGSAIASEIGTMVITEEVDALKTMALNPLRYLVIPKVHALLLSLPLLTMFANLVGIIGGLAVGYLYLDISPVVFINRMVSVLQFRDLLTGLVKSLVFAGLIVITGSFYGLRVKGGPEGVGRVTTASVVTSIFLVILADSALGLLFYFG